MKRLRALLLLSHLILAHYITEAQEAALPGEAVPGAEAARPEGEAPGGTEALPNEAILPEQEAPKALFGAKIGDSEVEFFLSGSWTATLSGSLGWLFSPGGEVLFPEAFPGYESGRLFQQTPNLTVSVWLAQRYFLEASIIGDFLEGNYDYFDENYLLLGYRGQENEFLRHLYVGTRDIGISPYPFLEAPDAGSSSIGASALMAGGISSHELLLRYDNNEPAEYVFLGRNLLSEQVVPLDHYLRGRFFRLPDAGVSDLAVYLEDPDGDFTGSDGLRYRLATIDDAALDSTNGTVSLTEVPTGSVLVFYRKGAYIVGDVALGTNALANTTGSKLDPSSSIPFNFGVTYLGQPMSERRVTVGSTLECLRLWRPGEFSPFESLGGYAVDGSIPEELSRLRIAVHKKGSDLELPNPSLRFSSVPGDDHFVVSRLPATRDNLRNLYPFLDDPSLFPGDTYPVGGDYDPENLLYGPYADPADGYLDYELRVGYLTPVSEFRLGTDVVPGSVQVLRNGSAETRFEVDYTTGVLEFLVEIGPDDRLEVRFRRRQSLTGNGDLLFVWGNTIALGPDHTLELATGLRWNFLPGSYTTEAYSRTGSVVASAALQGSFGPAAYELSVAGAYTNPDTSGIMRLLGMESSGLEAALSEASAYPAAPPADDSPFGITPTVLNRGVLFYKDYRSYGFAGTSSLLSYTASPPAEQVFPYATGSKPGPYQAAGSSAGTSSGESLVLDFQLGDDQWVGTQLPLASQSGVVDFSALEGVSVSFRAVDVTPASGGSFRVFLQIGDLGEDLDEDGILDQELSAAAAGFAFNDAANAAVLKVGTSPRNEANGRRDTEDVDGSGFLDGEGSGIVTVELTALPISADTAWTVVSGSLDADQKAKLHRVRSLRLLVVESGTGTVSGRVLVDRINLAGSRFWADSVGGSIAAREVEEWASADPPPEPLLEAFPDVATLFHPQAETQKVLQVDWSGVTGGWKVRGYTEAASEGIDYRSIVYYYRLPSVTGASDLQFSLSDPEGGKIAWSIPASVVDAWQEIRVDRNEGRVYRNGSLLAGAAVSEDSATGSLDLLEITQSGTTDGLLYLDELHLTDPRGALGAAASLALDVELPGTLWAVGGHPVLHDVRLRERAELATAGFASLYGIPERTGRFSSRSELEAGVSVVDVDVAVDVVAQEGELTAGGSHRLEVPNVPFPVKLSDSYSYRTRETGQVLQRENRLSLDLAPLLQARFYNTAGNVEDVLTQEWGGALGLTPGPFSFENSFQLILGRSNFAVPQDGYFRNWAWGYTLLRPAPEGDPLERKASLNLDWRYLPSPVGVTMLGSMDLHSYDLSASGRDQAGDFALELGVPVELGSSSSARGRQLRLEPGYRRSLSLLTRETTVGDVSADFSTAGSAFESQRYAYTGIPFWELYDARLAARFLADSASVETASYQAESFLRVSRTFSSRLRDLLLPSYFEAAVDRALERDGDLTRVANYYKLQSRWRAINLFGRFGAYPHFPWYRTDEFSGDLAVSLGTENGVLEIDELRLEHVLSLENGELGSLSLENRLRITLIDALEWSDGMFLSLDWYRYPEGGISLPLLPPRIKEGSFWSHRESLACKLAGPAAGVEATSYHPLNLTVSHQTAVNLPERGLVSARVGLGLDLERTSDGSSYWRFAIEGAIEARLEF